MSQFNKEISQHFSYDCRINILLVKYYMCATYYPIMNNYLNSHPSTAFNCNHTSKQATEEISQANDKYK